MKRTVCVIHGAGSDVNLGDMQRFIARMRHETGGDYESFGWSHTGSPPTDSRGSWLFPPLRDWVHEIIMDFTYVVQTMGIITASIPKADIYIGHSAGGMIAASNKRGKPTVLLGCPLQVVRNVNIKTCARDTLNIMHYRDPVAAPVDGADNLVTYAPLLKSWINPFAAHNSYWTSEKVIKYIVNWMKKV